MSENGEIYTAGIKFTLPPAVTAVTNLTSGCTHTDDNRGPDARESQSPRDFRGPTIYGLDEAKARE